MALQFVSPSAEIGSRYQQSLLDFFGPRDREVTLFHLPVGTLGLADLQRGATLDQVVDSGCRFLAQWPDGTWTSCEMTNPGLYGQAELRNFESGGQVALAFARISAAQQLDAVQTGDFELHLLSIPGIFFEGLHLVSKNQGIDLVLPVVSPHDEIPAGAVLDAATFLAAARSIAKVRVAYAAVDDLSS